MLSFSIDAFIRTEPSPVELMSETISALRRSGLSHSTWHAPGLPENVYKRGGAKEYGEHLRSNPGYPLVFLLRLATEFPFKMSVWRDLDLGWRMTVYDERGTDSTPAHLLCLLDIARAISRISGVGEVYVQRLPYGNTVFPAMPPIAMGNHAVLTSDAEVAAAYDEPDVFWHAWDTVEVIGARKLCIRGMDAIDDARWLAQTFEHTMAMVRAARPMKTGYERFPLSPDEKRWWTYGSEGGRPGSEPVLAFVGYLPAEQLVEYSCFLAPGAHVHVQEIYTIRELLLRGENYGGQPIKTIRVVFAAKHMALSERRPLLDVGARVYYVDGDEPDMVEVLE